MIKRYKDVKKRFEFVYAERNMYAKGTKEYEALSEIIKLILGEYGKEYTNNRYSFRFATAIIILLFYQITKSFKED